MRFLPLFNFYHKFFFLIIRVKRKFALGLKLFVYAHKEWRYPDQHDVLIYDATGWDVLKPYFNENKVAVLWVNGERLNVSCLIRALFQAEFWKGAFFSAYTFQYVQAVSPKVLITFIDNSIGFYELAGRFPASASIFIQNGVRALNHDIFDGRLVCGYYQIDYMLVHNESIGAYYRKYIAGTPIAIGSLKNNSLPRQTPSCISGVVFISQWRPSPGQEGLMFTTTDGVKVYWENYYKSEVAVLKFLDHWAKQNGKHIKICGFTSCIDGFERDFYASYLTTCDWQFIPRESEYGSYELVDSAELVVFIDSTLGYEAIARGKRAASLSCRLSDEPSLHRRFGWPGALPLNGPYWTSERNDIEFQRVLDYLTSVDDTQFINECRPSNADVMDFDPGNRRFVALLDQLLPT